MAKCNFCGAIFESTPETKRYKHRCYCSDACYNAKLMQDDNNRIIQEKKQQKREETRKRIEEQKELTEQLAKAKQDEAKAKNSQYRKLTDCIYEVFHIDPKYEPKPTLIFNQIRLFKRDLDMSYDEMRLTFRYIYVILGFPIPSVEQRSIGLIPYYAEEAKRYANQIKAVEKDLKQKLQKAGKWDENSSLSGELQAFDIPVNNITVSQTQQEKFDMEQDNKWRRIENKIDIGDVVIDEENEQIDIENLFLGYEDEYDEDEGEWKHYGKDK